MQEQKPPDRRADDTAAVAAANAVTSDETKIAPDRNQFGDTDDTEGHGVDQVAAATRWYANHRKTCPHPLVPELRRRFGISTINAVRVLQAAATRSVS